MHAGALPPWEMQKAIDGLQAERDALRAENDKLREALEPFAQMGKAMMGHRHHNEAVITYALAPTIKVHHLVAARAALAEGGSNG